MRVGSVAAKAADKAMPYRGMFLPGRIYAPFADNATKFETGLELRF